MRLQPLYDLQQEINRLFIAGSKFAKGDPRLQKHIPVLNKLGEKAPVFAKLAKDIEDLIIADTQQSSEKLMAISTLLYSVLYTQGELVETEEEEAVQQPNISLEEINTEYSYLQLKPVMQALTTSNSGRLEILQDALERNIFNDSRTYQYLDIALADKYSDLADYVEKTVIPKVGKPMIPFLLKKFQYEDKTEQVRRFRLLCAFRLPQVPEMVERIMSESLPNLQAEAIHYLSADLKNEELIIKLADDKNKVVREASYKALAKLGTQASIEKLKEVYLTNKNKGNRTTAIEALASTKLPFFFQEVFDKVVESFEEFIALNKTADDKVLENKLETFAENIKVLNNEENPAIEEFFARVLTDKQYNSLVSAKKNLLEGHAYTVSYNIIFALGSTKVGRPLAFYEKYMSDIPDNTWKTPLWSRYLEDASDAGYSKEKLYDTFIDVYRSKLEVNVSDLYFAFSSDSRNYYERNGEEIVIYPDRVDKRWLKELYDIFTEKFKWNYDCGYALKILNSCETDNDKLDQLYRRIANHVSPNDAAGTFYLIMKRGMKDRFELIYQICGKYRKGSSYYYFYSLKGVDFWKEFPGEYAAKFRTLYEQNKLDIFNDIADIIEEANKK